LKILLIIPNLRRGGAERLVLDILREFLSLENTQIKLVIFRNEIDYAIDDIEEHIKIIPSSVFLSLKRKPILQINELQKFIEEFKPNIIHTHLFEAELVSRFCFYPKAEWFSHIHDNMVQLNNCSFKTLSNKQALTNYYEKRVLFKNYQKNGGTHFIAISKHTESYIKSVQSKYPVALLHNAINVKRFQKPTNSSSPALSEVEVRTPRTERSRSANSSPLTIINIGSFVSKKNQTFLLDIILELNKKGIQTSCFFLGDGPLKPEVEKRAIKLGVINQCHFIGNVDKVEEYLWQSNVYIHTATYEPLGLVLLEAMAAGLPVVSLDGGGNRDLMIQGRNGYLIEKQDPKLFVASILEVYGNNQISGFIHDYAKQFDIESYCEKLYKIKRVN
jgi:glycosyltransferase involved in cell wall biosynthesis